MREGSGLGLLVRRHLGRRGLGVLIVLVTAVTSFALVGGAREINSAVDQAVGARLDAAPVIDTNLTLRRESTGGYFEAQQVVYTQADNLTELEDPFGPVTRRARDILGPRVTDLIRSQTHRAESGTMSVSPAGPHTHLAVDPPQLVLVLQSGLTDRVRWVTGRAPHRSDEVVRIRETPSDPVVSRPLLEIALSDETARAWGVRVGDRLRLDPGLHNSDRAAVVEIVGTYTASEPSDALWATDRLLLRRASVTTEQGGTVTRADGVVADDAFSDLSNVLMPLPRTMSPPNGIWESLVESWTFRLDSSAIRAEDVAPIEAAIGRLATSQSQLTSTPPYARVITGLTPQLEAYARDVAVTRSILAVVVAAALVLSLLVLALTAHVLVERRRDGLRLLRARGASLPQLCSVVGAEVLVWAVPAAVVGAAAGFLVPGRTGWLPLAGVLGVLIVPLSTAMLSTRSSVRTLTTRSLASRDGGVPRVTAEVIILALAAFAVSATGQRGHAVSTGNTDVFVALTPVLLALAVAVVVARLLPWPARWAADVAARGRGALGFVGMARAARERPVALVPLVALLLATAIALLMATVTTSADRERTLTSWRTVGAQARVETQRLDPADVQELRSDPHVTDVVPAFRTDHGSLITGGASGGTLVTVIGVDPERYAALLADSPLAFDAAPLRGSGSDQQPTDPLPALVPPGVVHGSGGARISAGGRSIPIEVVGTDPALRRGSTREQPVVLVSLDALQAIDPSVRATTAYVNTIPGTVLSANAVSSPLVVEVVDRTGWLRDVTDLPLPTVVRHVFAAGAVLAAIDSILAVLLLLALTTPGRREVLIRLRTMGLPRGGERRLVAYEIVPIVLAALVPGVVVGLLLPRVVGDVLDLAAFTGGPPHPPITADPWWAFGLVIAVCAVVLVGLVIDAARAGRSGIAQHLRQGDQT